MPLFQFAFNNTVHATTGYAPFEILYGYPARMADNLTQNAEGLEMPKDYETYTDKLRATLKIVHDDVFDCTVKAKLKGKIAEKGRVARSIAAGDMVLVSKENRTKLDPVRVGPFEVIQVQYPNATLDNGETIHMDRLRICKPPTVLWMWHDVPTN